MKLPKIPTNIDLNNVYAFDFETKLIGLNTLAPEPICVSLAHDTQGATLVSNGDKHFAQYLHDFIKSAVDDPAMIIVAQNAKFDLHVITSYLPELYDDVILLYDRGQIVCTILVEKLLNLTTTGWVDKEPKADEEDAKGKKIEYSLASLVLSYTGEDISASKEAEDAVRLRYQELDGIPSERYPIEFRQYSIEDSTHLLNVFKHQLDKRSHVLESLGYDPLETLSHRCSLDFHLYRYSIEGVRTNPEQIQFLEVMLDKELSFEKLNLLYPTVTLEDEVFTDLTKLRQVYEYLNYQYELSVLKPDIPERISFRWSHKSGCTEDTDPVTGLLLCGEECFPKVAKKHHDDCKKKSCKFTRQWLCDCPAALVQSQKGGLNTKFLKAHVLKLWNDDSTSYDLMFSDAADKDEEFSSKWDDYENGILSQQEALTLVTDNLKYISTKREWLDTFSFKDPILEQFDHRAGLVKLKTTEIPRMKTLDGSVSPVVHGNYDVLKETGRTSGFASSLYPSANLQNIHKMARTCFKAREGHWILSTDYSGLEFVSAAQRALNLLGESTYAKIINKGWDAHAYLASQRAYRSEKWFEEECSAKNIKSNEYESIYHEFMKYKKNDKQIGFEEGKVDDKGQPVPKKFFKFYRGSAKPIGLGILGGMGTKTIAQVCGATYKIHMTPDEAKEYKDIFEEIFYPEARLLQIVNQDMIDPMFSSKKKKKFRYVTPMGMVRPNCSYAACANGSILQSPSAEGATLAVIAIAKACYSPSSTSILKGNFKPWGFVHDEILGDVIADPAIATLVANEVERIMVDSLKLICPDIQPSADSALMIEWDKRAEKVLDSNGNLVPWVKSEK